MDEHPLTKVPNTLNVSVALDKATLQATVALRDLSQPERYQSLTSQEARHIAALLVHTAKLVDGNNALADALAKEGKAHEEIRLTLDARYRHAYTEYRRPDQ